MECGTFRQSYLRLRWFWKERKVTDIVFLYVRCSPEMDLRCNRALQISLLPDNFMGFDCGTSTELHVTA